MRALVTGATGMVGANLVRRLVAEGHEVTALLRPTSSRLRLHGLEDRLRVAPGDLTDAASVRRVLHDARPEVVFHLASTIWGRIPEGQSSGHVAVNITGTCHVLDALRSLPKTRLVFTGSSAAYGPGSHLSEAQRLSPNTFYGAAKASASLFVQTAVQRDGLSAVELRLFMPYGPWEHPNRLIPQVILSALEGRDVPMTAGTQQRDLIYMDDVIEALLLAATRPVPAGAVFNIGSGSAITVRQLVEQLLRLMGNPVKALVGAVPMRPDEIMEMSADITAARRQLGWAPRISLEEGLRRAIAWFTEHRDLAGQLAQPPSESARETVGASR